MDPGGGSEATARPALPGRPVSPWLDGRSQVTRPALDRDLDVDIAVIGAGIVGLTTALLLARAGARVALLERRWIGAGVTGNTTAKVTSLHGLAYSSLVAAHGNEAARAYGEANQAGLELIASLVTDLGIDCPLRRKPHLVYTEDPSELGRIEEEVAAAFAAGLPVSYAAGCDLPFAIAGAVRAEEQLEIDPLRYLDGLAAALERSGALICERSAALGVSGGEVAVEGGNRVRAGHVIVATQLPILDRGMLFARAKPSRSYALTVRVEEPVPQGMYLSTESPPHSMRALERDRDELLIVAGEGAAMGSGDPAESFRALERFARGRLGATGVEHRWSAHDYVPEDGLPYIGRLLPRSGRLLTATGMNKWGLAMGTAAARMLADQAQGRTGAWTEVFDPWRLPALGGARSLLEHNARSGLRFLGDRLGAGGGASELWPGEGKVVGAGPWRRAVHRDDDGALHALSARCTHLGCIVRWNGAERTWDCPCHGSRFAATGEVLNGPATHPLARRDPPH